MTISRIDTRTQRTQRSDRLVRRSLSVVSCPWCRFVFAARRHAPRTDGQRGPPTAGYKREPGMPSSTMPAPLREIGFDQNLDQRVPLDTTFRDEAGRDRAARRLLRHAAGRAGVRVLRLPDAVHAGDQRPGERARRAVARARARISRSSPSASIRATRRRLAAAKKAVYLERYKRPGAADGWHFLTGDQPSIERLTKAAGFRYAWDDETKQFAHPTGVIVLTPDGRLARYLFGIEYGPRDLRLAIVEASDGKVGSPVDALLLYCYHYDPMTGRYGLVIMRAIRLAGAATVLALGAFIVVMVRRETPDGSATRSHAARTSALVEDETDLICGPAPRSSPSSASTMAGRVDALYFFLLAICGVLLAADRRPDRLLRGQVPPPRAGRRRRARSTAAWCSRSTWTVIPFLITMVIFVWGASVFFAMSRPPDETLNIYVVGKQWMWKFQHLDGQREINELHVPVGRAGEADHDVRGRHPRRLRPGVPRQGRRHARPLHQHLVPADQAGPLSPVLRRVLRHPPLGHDRRGRRDGAERLPDLAERRRAGRIARVGRREAVPGSRVQHLPSARRAGPRAGARRAVRQDRRRCRAARR